MVKFICSQLIKLLPNLNEKSKELPLSRTYSIKTRAIIHAHLSRIPLNPDTLDKDRQFIIKKCPYLVQEMVSCVNQLIMLAYARRISKLPTIETIENCMKLSPLLIQGLWEFKSQLLQLPYLTDEHLRYFQTKKRHIKTLQQFAQLPSDDRRAVVKNLNDAEYENLLKVLGQMPLIDFSHRCEVVDDEDSNVVTAGAIVTVTVTLRRRNMSILFGDPSVKEKQVIKEPTVDEDGNVEVLDDGALADEQAEQAAKLDDKAAEQKVKKPVWMNKSKGHKTKSKSKSTTKNQKNIVVANAAAVKQEKSKDDENETGRETAKQTRSNDSEGDDSGSDSDSGTQDGPTSRDAEKDEGSSDDNKKMKSMEDDDVEWEKYVNPFYRYVSHSKCCITFRFQQNKREKLEGRSKVSHGVHCPLYAEVRSIKSKLK